MATAISYMRRKEIVNRKLMGQNLRAISVALFISLSVVKKWWRRFRIQGQQALAVKKTKPLLGGAMSRFDPMVSTEALLIKKARPHWSATRILRELSLDKRLYGLRVPSARTLNRLFAQNIVVWKPLKTKRFRLHRAGSRLGVLIWSGSWISKRMFK